MKKFFGNREKRRPSSPSLFQRNETDEEAIEKYNAYDSYEDEEEIYIVRQQYGYLSIGFAIVQIIVLALMMWQCGVAPLQLNPMVGPYPDALSEWGGKNAVLILEDGEWYRLVTPIFLHAGVIHLLGNVAVQLESGVFFEKEWGSLRWLLIYLSSAVGSSVLSVIFMPSAVSVGSSGAVMGLFGGKLAEVILRICERRVTKQDHVAHEVRKEQCCVVTVSVIIVMAFSFIPFVDWAAHLGGLVAGFCIGVAIFAFEIENHLFKLLWLIIGLGVTFAYFYTTLDYMYGGNVEAIDELRDVCSYYKEHFQDYECNCMREEYLNGNNNNQGEKRLWL
jgi:membrane associated rhomboid family serine protease